VKPAALGFRVHSGWTAMVALAGPVSSPTILDRRIVHLVRAFTYTYRQPYHTAAKMPFADAAEFIKNARSEAEQLALAAICNLKKQLTGLDWKLSACGLMLASGRALPQLENILASHALIHTADGELFRDAIRAACRKCQLPLAELKERSAFDEAAAVLKAKANVLKRRIDAMGKPLGPPWSADEKLSALAAWVSLAD
jgi:hypothetical protein